MTALSRATRRVIVAHLTDRGMSPAEIASELGVSRDTVRRDLTEVPPPAPAPEPEPAPLVAVGLRLPDGVQLRQDVNILAAEFRARPEDVARFAIHQAAQAVRKRWASRLSSGSGSTVRPGQRSDAGQGGQASGSAMHGSGFSGTTVRPVSAQLGGGTHGH
ncbi:helix-turn-helix domain-containing protein [Streptomyces sp. NPDC057148]|uniref:helix-turn-helix domain-containing protein n=1 Tax=unclassified Streptomyces TaxID=2593676 RepID=UPI003631ED5B